MRFLPILFAATAAVTAQSPLTTTFAGGNGQSGNMFEVVATSTGAGVTIQYFDVNTNSTAPADFEVYTLAGSYAGQENNASAWTLVGSAAGVPCNGFGVATLLPICVDLYVAPGATQSFYVTHSDANIMAYTNGTATGSLYTSNADLEFYEGSGHAYPFLSNFNPRVWNGNINYAVGNTAGAGCSFASKENYGSGCGNTSYASFYEQLASAAMDLDGQKIDALNTGAGYLVQTVPSLGGITQGPSAVIVPAGDDDFVDTATVGGTLGIFVGSNGNISRGAANGNGFVPSVSTMLGNANEGIYAWTDLHSTSGGGSGDIYYEESGTVATVTYLAVAGWNTGVGNTIQFVWDTATGNFSIEFENLNLANPEDWLVGYSPAGANLDPGPTDLSGLTGGNILLTGASDSSALELNSNRPLIGANWDLTTDYIDAVSPIAITFFGDRSPIAVPFTTIGIASPGCDINLATALSNASAPNVGGSASLSVAIPNNPALAGAKLSAQSICLTVQNLGGLLSSNGLEGTLGN